MRPHEKSRLVVRPRRGGQFHQRLARPLIARPTNGFHAHPGYPSRQTDWSAARRQAGRCPRAGGEAVREGEPRGHAARRSSFAKCGQKVAARGHDGALATLLLLLASLNLPGKSGRPMNERRQCDVLVIDDRDLGFNGKHQRPLVVFDEVNLQISGRSHSELILVALLRFTWESSLSSSRASPPHLSPKSCTRFDRHD